MRAKGFQLRAPDGPESVGPTYSGRDQLVSELSNARVVVIGGGIVGCSVLYHLAKSGLTDALLLERQELTSGSSWHAAGNLFSLTSPSNAQRLQKYTIELYPKLEAESGQQVGYHPTGGLVLASTA